MLSVDEALELVLARATIGTPLVVSTNEAQGLVLAEDVVSDVDSPPHDKSIVDGYALICADLAGGSADLEIIEEVTAGAVPTRAVTRGRTSRIMTGAPLPEGADSVVMIEQAAAPVSGAGGTRVSISTSKITAGQNIMRRAKAMAAGDVVLRAGALLRSIELGVLAEVGRVEVRAIPRPSLAVLSTGNELVAPLQVPAAGQIRNSNGPMLVAAARTAGAQVLDLGIATDDESVLATAIARGLECDVLVISGGVSAGVLDLVPGVLARLGVAQVFHKVHLKPGKPLWFGVRVASARNTLVFGLPGNPVSSLVCFELFVRPAIGRMAGRGDAALAETTAALTTAFSHRSDRPTYHPARLSTRDGQSLVEPLVWHGSGDLRTLAAANALACFPAGQRDYRAGDSVRTLRLSEG